MRLEDKGNLYTAGAVNPPSDRNVKTDFTAVDTTELLEKVAALPIQSWRYKHDQATRHISPVAQDFHAAFQVGTDDKHIATVDADGVALAAIQGLHQKVEQENAKLRAENAEMKARLVALEAPAAKQARAHTRLEALEARFERMFQVRARE
jgi:trimeric autotransporter adhesin